VSCNVSASDPTGSFESTCADFGADIRSWDFSAQFGGALNIGMVRVGAAYDLGLVTIDPNEFLDVKSRALMFFATVSFGVKRR